MLEGLYGTVNLTRQGGINSLDVLQSVSQSSQSIVERNTFSTLPDPGEEELPIMQLFAKFHRLRRRLYNTAQRGAAHRWVAQVIPSSANTDINHVGGIKDALVVGFWVGKARYFGGDDEE